MNRILRSALSILTLILVTYSLIVSTVSANDQEDADEWLLICQTSYYLADNAFEELTVDDYQEIADEFEELDDLLEILEGVDWDEWAAIIWLRADLEDRMETALESVWPIESDLEDGYVRWNIAINHYNYLDWNSCVEYAGQSWENTRDIPESCWDIHQTLFGGEDRYGLGEAPYEYSFDYEIDELIWRALNALGA